MKVLLQGYIGHANFEYDLLFKIAVDRFKNISNISLSVVVPNSIDASYLKNIYPELKIIKGPISLLFYKKYDLVFYIGGGVFFDYKKSINLLPYVKKQISNYIRYQIPKLLGTKFAGVGIGIGPYYSKRAMKTNQQLLKTFSLLGVRDKVSYNYAQKMTKATKLKLTNDLSIGYKITKKTNKNDTEIVICPRSYAHKPEFEKHLTELLKLAKKLEAKNYKTHWIFLQNDDEKLIKKIKKSFKITIWNPKEMDVDSFIYLFQNKKAVITSRMHSIYMAGLFQTPIISIDIHQKLEYANNLFYENPIHLDPLSNLDDYEKALKDIVNLRYKTKSLQTEKNILTELDKEIDIWLMKMANV